MQLLAGAFELADRFRRHRFDRLAGDRLVVGDDDDALAHIGRRAVESSDRYVGLLCQSDERRLRIAVIRRQYDAVCALGDAIFDLLELPVSILAAVELDDFNAVVLKSCHNCLVAGHPKTSREILERVANFLALCGGRGRCRERGQASHRSCGAV